MNPDGKDIKARSGCRVIIVDDSRQVRLELCTLLPLAGQIEVVGEAADGREAIRLAAALRPDVILLDLEMPILDGYEAARQIKAGRPDCRIVALTAYGDPDTRRRALQAGVDRFVIKGASVGELVGAICEGEIDHTGCGV